MKMARSPRLNLIGIPQHVIQRGYNRQACFFENQNYQVYLDKLLEYSQKHQVEIHAFILMTNHVHLLATPRIENGISLMMQSLGRYYVRYINQTYHRTGTLWEGRYKSNLVDSDNFFLVVTRYIEFNPVRAEMVVRPELYPWSSYHQHALGKTINLLTEHDCYLKLGDSASKQQQSYLKLCKRYLSDNEASLIRSSVNKAWVLGDDRFKQQIERQLGVSVSPKARGGDRKSINYQSKG